MTQRVVKDGADLELLKVYLDGRKLPLTIDIQEGRDRSNEQNRLSQKWYSEISSQTGEEREDVRARCKLRFGLPILMEASKDFRDLSELLERWADIAETGGLYQVSTLGRVRSLYRRDKWGNSVARQEPLVLSAANTGRYLMVSLSIHGKKLHRSVHVLVAEAFIGPRPNGAHCAHMDGNGLNNPLPNLAWVSAKENERHKELHGTKAQGSRHGIAKLTEDAVRDIRAIYRKGNGAALAQKYGISLQNVVSVALRRSWKHV